MRSNEFLDRFGKFNAVFSRSDAEQRAMKLRDSLLTPRGARGPQAPHLEPVNMARLTIALTASETAPRAADTVIEYAKMSAIGKRLFGGANDFETALTEIFKGKIDNKEGRFKIDVNEVVVCRSWPEATIILMDRSEFKFSTLEPPNPEKMVCRIDFHIGWPFLHNIISALATEKRMAKLKTKIKTNADSDAHFLYIQQMNKIGEKQGGDAARACGAGMEEKKSI